MSLTKIKADLMDAMRAAFQKAMRAMRNPAPADVARRVSDAAKVQEAAAALGENTYSAVLLYINDTPDGVGEFGMTILGNARGCELLVNAAVTEMDLVNKFGYEGGLAAAFGRTVAGEAVQVAEEADPECNCLGCTLERTFNGSGADVTVLVLGDAPKEAAPSKN